MNIISILEELASLSHSHVSLNFFEKFPNCTTEIQKKFFSQTQYFAIEDHVVSEQA